jgi:hypothetical protein
MVPSPHAPTWDSQSAGAPYLPQPSSGSGGIAYAETAPPPTREEFEARQAAAQAAAARGVAPPAGYAPAPGYAHGIVPQSSAIPGSAQDPDSVPEGAPRVLAGFFISFDIDPHGRFWPIYQGRSRIGRQGSGTELDLELDHPTTSSRHAVAYASACPGRIKLEDTGSTNGTLINGARLPPGTRHELNDGDRVRFGLLSTIVKIV